MGARVAGGVLLVLVGLALAARPAAAQAPLAFVNDSTQVSAVGFRFADTRTFEPVDLALIVATKGPTGVCETGFLSKILGWLPFCGSSGVYPLNPVELQKDVLRLERYYRRNGFPFPEADYEVELDTAANAAAVTFTIAEGAPIRIAAITFLGPDNGPADGQFDAADPAATTELRAEWEQFTKRTEVRPGDRLDDFSVVQLQSEVLRWLRESGYAFARVSAETAVDTLALTADVRVKLEAGPLAVYDTINVVGARSVPVNVVLRELPFRPGDPFRQSRLTEGQREILGLPLFQLAAVDVAPDQPADSTVNIRVTVREAPARTITGRVGFFSESGATAEAEWTHRNFFGGARTFTPTLQAWTGVGAFPSDGYPDRRYRAAVTLRQPYFFHRRFSAAVTPSVETRDDEIETSRQARIETSVLYEAGTLRTAALTYAFTRRQILEQGEGGLLDPASPFFGGGTTISRGELRLSTAYGRVDDAINPTRGIILRPVLAVAGLAPGSVRYGMASLNATGLLPFGQRSGVVARFGAGALYPFGGSDIDLYLEDYFGSRDALFFGGGTGDVRGWATNQLGPKFLDLRQDSTRSDELATLLSMAGSEAETDSLVALFYAEGLFVRPSYLPIGGRYRLFGSVQLNLPLPIGPNWGANVFLDAGRVWAPAEFIYNGVEFAAVNDGLPNLLPLVQRFRDTGEGFRVGTGAGIQYLTPVGFLSFAVGVKLNPSYFDLRAPADVLLEVDPFNFTGDPVDLDSVPTSWVRRLAFHLAIGQRF